MTDIPIIETYRGVGIQNEQDAERIALVKAEIDQILAMTPEVPPLLAIVRNDRWSPEARMLSAAMLRGLWEVHTDDRRARPMDLDLEEVSAWTAGLHILEWRSPWRYGSLLCHTAAERKVPLE